MPLFRLSREPVFPSPELADEDGLLAVGGDLGTERLLRAYSIGIFPWYSEGCPILWWSPDPRLILMPEELKVSRSLRRVIEKGLFSVTFDKAFDAVIRHCAEIHRAKEGSTWITGDMIAAYIRLHRAGFAHSVEVRHQGELVGGLYGVALGGVFFGESMFALRSNASKVGFVRLVRSLIEWKFAVIDCQVTTEHLRSFGAREVRRSTFMSLLATAMKKPTMCGKWTVQDG